MPFQVGVGAPDLDARLGRPGLEVLRVAADDVSRSPVHPEPVGHLVREPQVHGLVAEVHALDPVLDQELVAKMRALVEEARQRREVACPVREREAHDVVGVDEVARRRVHVEEAEDAGLDPDLPDPAFLPQRAPDAARSSRPGWRGPRWRAGRPRGSAGRRRRSGASGDPRSGARTGGLSGRPRGRGAAPRPRRPARSASRPSSAVAPPPAGRSPAVAAGPPRRHGPPRRPSRASPRVSRGRCPAGPRPPR